MSPCSDITRKRVARCSGRRGFTLVEMLISLSIFAVVTAFAMANFRVGRDADELRLSARQVSVLITRARTQAVGGLTVSYCHEGSLDGTICSQDEQYVCGEGQCLADVPPAYGINISPSAAENREVRIFADTNDNGRMDSGEIVRYDSFSPGPFVFVDSVTPSDANGLDIIFQPPKPKVLFNNDATGGIAEITLKHTNTGDTSTVTVNRISGLITVE